MYRARFSTIYIIIIAGVLLWSIITYRVAKSIRKSPNHIWKIVNIICVLLSSYEIFVYTILNRPSSDTHIFIFAAEYNPEFYREMLMNAFLYYPFGLTLSVLVGPWSVLIAFVLSATIESWQYFAGTGTAQITDVLMNTLGCAIGCLPWVIIKSMKRITEID